MLTTCCPHCGSEELSDYVADSRSLLESAPVKAKRVVQKLHGKRLARLLARVPEQLVLEYRQAPAKHADETPWRTNGQNGYAWLFATETLSLFYYRETRSAVVPRAVFGDQPLYGVLVVDRYAAYNRLAVSTGSADPIHPHVGAPHHAQTRHRHRHQPVRGT